MKHVDHGDYIEHIPETESDRAWLEKTYPHLVHFHSVCEMKRKEPVQMPIVDWRYRR